MTQTRMAAWLEQLPQGVDSHADCQVKGSLLRRLVKSQQLQPHLRELPTQLHPWFENPPLVNAWVPEVHLFTMLHALRDFVYDEAQLHAFLCAGIERMISSPLYRMVFLLLSPKRLLTGLGRRWDQFHRGTTMEVLRDHGHAIDVRVDHPPNLYSRTIRDLTAATFLTAVQAAGGEGYRMQALHDDSTPSISVFRAFRP